MRRRHRPCDGVVPHFPRPGAVEAARARVERSWRGPVVRWASDERPTASRCGVTLQEGSATQMLRWPASAVDRGAKRGPRRPAFRPRTARQGAAAAAGGGLGRGGGRSVTPPRLRIAVGEDRDDPRPGSRGRREEHRQAVGNHLGCWQRRGWDERDPRLRRPDRAVDASPAAAEVIRGYVRCPRSS